MKAKIVILFGLALIATASAVADEIQSPTVKADEAVAQNRLDEAEKYFQDALAQISHDDPERVLVLQAYANCLRMRGDLKKAETQLADAIGLISESDTLRASTLADCLDDLAVIQDAEEHQSDAQKSLKKAFKILADRVGDQTPDAAFNLILQGNHYHQFKKIDEALTGYRKALNIFEQTTGSDSMEVATALDGISVELSSANPSNPEIETTCKRALQIYKNTVQANEIDFIESADVYLKFLRKVGRAAEADKLDTELKSVRAKECLTRGVRACGKMNFEEAIGKFKQALECNPTMLRAKEDLSIAYNNSAVSDLRNSKLDSAEVAIRNAIDISKGMFGTSDARVLEQTKNLAQILTLKGNAKEAQRLYEEVLIVEDQDGAKKDELADTLICLALAEQKNGKSDGYKIHIDRARDLLNLKEEAAIGQVATGSIQYPRWDSKTVESTDYGPFMAALQKQIKSNWTPPKNNESKHTIVSFRLHHNGQISRLRLVRSSGNDEVDKAGMQAVKATNPALPLPDKGNGNADIQFSFDYNVKRADGSTSSSSHRSIRRNPVNGLHRLLPLGLPYIP